MPHVQLGSFLSNSIGCGCVAIPAPSHGPTDRRQVRLHSGDSLAGCAGPDKRACGSDQVMKNPSLVPGKRGCPPPSYARRVACRQVDACLPYRAPVPADQVAAQHHHGAHVVHLSRPQLLLCPPHRHVYLCALIPRRSLRAHKVRVHTLRSFHSRTYNRCRFSAILSLAHIQALQTRCDPSTRSYTCAADVHARIYKRCRPVAMLLHAHIQALQTRCDPYTRANISAADSLRCFRTRIYKRCRYTAIAPHGIFERCRLAAIRVHADIQALKTRFDPCTRAHTNAADSLRSFHTRIHMRCRCTAILIHARIYRRCRPSFCHFRIQLSFF